MHVWICSNIIDSLVFKRCCFEECEGVKTEIDSLFELKVSLQLMIQRYECTICLLVELLIEVFDKLHFCLILNLLLLILITIRIF
ncbi:hypothetical protein RIR_jg17374.t1 [Rhizophagus irregularis DAOM 181602=DAOM 197198]|nr:hypothetical protein RIR_jg17374.t1 [Rhizophagus irregularis DAOM 181602=DAOM 197198]